MVTLFDSLSLSFCTKFISPPSPPPTSSIGGIRPHSHSLTLATSANRRRREARCEIEGAIITWTSRMCKPERATSLQEQGARMKHCPDYISRRSSIATVLSICIASNLATQNAAFAQPALVFREYIDTFDGYSFTYPANWIPVKGAGADIFFRDPFVLDENLSVDISSPSSSKYKSVEDLGPPDIAAKKILKQYITEFMSTRLGVRRESNIISASSNVADDGRVYYQVEVNIKSYANTNELAIMPEDRVPRLEWDRRYLSVLGVENNRLYELRLQTPERVFQEEESDLRRVMDSFRVNKVLV